MNHIHRRRFLAMAAAGTAGVAALGSSYIFRHGLFETESLPLFEANGTDPTTLFLTWQQDPTTTITIQWLAPSSNLDTTIQYAPLNETSFQRRETFTKPYPNTDLTVHRCEVTGLAPGTDYQFQIGPHSKVHRFRTMPDKATDAIRFVSGGDSGTNGHAVANNILAAKQDPQFVLFGGDLAYDFGQSPDTFTRFLQNYRTHMIDSGGRLIPMLSCIGNHDVVGQFGRSRKDSPQYLSVFDGLYSERTFNVLDFGDYLSIVTLDTGHIAPVTGEQTDWLGKVLAERQDRQHLIVVNHVPAYPSFREIMKRGPGDQSVGEDQRENWCPLFDRYKVDVVLEHHDHTFKRTHPLINGHKDKNGVLYLGDGSWGKVRAPKSLEERPYLAAVAGSYHLSVHQLEGKQQVHTAIEESGKVADRYVLDNKRPSRRG